MWDASQSLDLDRLRIVLASVANPLLQAFLSMYIQAKGEVGRHVKEGGLLGWLAQPNQAALPPWHASQPHLLPLCYAWYAGTMLYRLW